MLKKDLKINFTKKLKTYFKNYWWKLIIIAGILLVDMLTKFLIVAEINIIDGVLAIVPTKNYGAGFSVLTGQTWLLIAITFVFLIGFIVFDVLFKYKSKLFGIATGLIVSGAIGNLIDRLAYGYVRDFIYLEFIDFPVFNIADIALTVGVILFAVYILFYLEKSKKQAKLVEQNYVENVENINNENVMQDNVSITDTENINSNSFKNKDIQNDNNIDN